MSKLGTDSSSSHERAVAALRARVLHRQSEWTASARRRRRCKAPRIVAAILRRASRFAGAVLRSPGLAAWGVTGAALAAFIVSDSIPRMWEVDVEALALDQLLHRARIAVEDARRVLGFNLKYLTVEGEQAESEPWAAKYVWKNKKIVFNLDYDLPEDELLAIAGHECVHALFDQAALDRYPREYDGWTCYLVEETSAYVVGADIAGRVRERRGGDGAVLRETLVQEYRRACDVYHPRSMHQRLWRHLAHFGEDSVDLEIQLGISVHFPSASLVDEVAASCQSSRDPYAAASAIAGRYWPTPTPTPEP